MAKTLHKYVTADIKGKGYSLQGWVIRESPLRIRCSDKTEYDCIGTCTIVINPPTRPAKSFFN